MASPWRAPHVYIYILYVGAVTSNMHMYIQIHNFQGSKRNSPFCLQGYHCEWNPLVVYFTFFRVGGEAWPKTKKLAHIHTYTIKDFWISQGRLRSVARKQRNTHTYIWLADYICRHLWVKHRCLQGILTGYPVMGHSDKHSHKLGVFGLQVLLKVNVQMIICLYVYVFHCSKQNSPFCLQVYHWEWTTRS